MPSAIPPPLASYIESCLIPTHSQTLITSVLNAPSPWLCLRFLYGALYGVGDEVETRDFLAARQRGSNDSMPVVFVSLLRPLNLWIEMGKKMVRALQYLGLGFLCFFLAPDMEAALFWDDALISRLDVHGPPSPWYQIKNSHSR